MASVSVRRRLPRDAFVVLAAYLTLHAVVMSRDYGVGWDAHAYYVAWQGGLYEALPGSVDAYNYSPVFAQLVWPLTWLPWPAFCALLVGAAALGVAWLVRPLPRVLAVAAWFACLPEILSGNVFWLLAVMAVLGLGRGAPWCVAAYSKVLPCLGPVWFLVRREWRHLAGFLAVMLVVFAVSFAISPGEWRAWAGFLRDSAGDSSGYVYLTPFAVYFPLVLRYPLALVLTVVGARTNRAWMLPVAMVLASPVVGWGTFALLAAIPRMRLAGPSRSGSSTLAVTPPEARSLTP